MEKFKHKYIFYFYPKTDIVTGNQLKGIFRFYGRVKDGKEIAKALLREFDYNKIF